MSTTTFSRPLRAALATAGLLLLAACTETAGRGSVLETYVSLFGQNEPSSPEPVVPGPEPRSEAATACQQTIAGRAKEYGAIQVEAASVGAPEQFLNGYTDVPVEVRILYRHEEQVQVRQARVICRVNALNSVVALTPAQAPRGL
jgi:hypothetical protein